MSTTPNDSINWKKKIWMISCAFISASIIKIQIERAFIVFLSCFAISANAITNTLSPVNMKNEKCKRNELLNHLCILIIIVSGSVWVCMLPLHQEDHIYKYICIFTNGNHVNILECQHVFIRKKHHHWQQPQQNEHTYTP